MRRVLPLLLVSFVSRVAWAAPETPTGAPDSPGTLDRMNATFAEIDAVFGTWFVAPLASALFYDVWFWDNTLEGQAAVGAAAGDEMVSAYEDSRGYAYVWRKTVSPTDVQLAPIDTTVVRVGNVDVEVAISGSERTARIRPAVVDLEGHQVGPYEGWEGPAFTPAQSADGRDLRVVRGLAPFPVLVEMLEDAARLLATDAPFAQVLGALRIEEGARVSVKDAPGFGTVQSVSGDQLVVVGLEPRFDAAAPANPNQHKIPFIVLWLILGALFFTVRMGFINLRALRHAVDVTRGQFDHPGDEGEISHFQALSSALSATVGLGNIAGVAVAVGTGGPGAVFWMVVAGFLGMSSKFVECTLGQMYRHIDERGEVSGGPMRYLEEGLRELKLAPLGKALAVLFAVMCIGGSFGGGNMFQANQAFAAVRGVVQERAGTDIGAYAWLFGVILAILVGLVIIGGIKRIGAAASFIVPIMCGMYVLAGFVVLVVNAGQVPSAISHIISEAFTPEAGYGGLLGVLIIGFQRAAFSNEAGVGSASIAHSAATTDEPIREGVVALLEPFIDTIIVCTMTGLVVVVTGAYKTNAGDGVLMTAAAFRSVEILSWFPILLSVAVLLFAFSTMISWSYYGERCFTFLFGQSARVSLVYRCIFLVFVFFGAVFKLGNVLDFSDLMVLGMAFPNIAGLVILSGKVRSKLDDYWSRYRTGAMPRHES